MNTKTLIGAVVGIVVIIVIVWISRSHGPSQPAQATDQMQTATGSATDQGGLETGTQSDGLQVTTTKQGTGAAAANGNTVTVNYTGTLEDGTIFDSNVDPKFGHVQPFSFKLGAGQVIKGWDEGVLGMKVGEKRHLVIPASLGYGAQGAGGVIPPDATLVFDVEVTGISK
jgi:peptidylprolyl isomerase